MEMSPKMSLIKSNALKKFAYAIIGERGFTLLELMIALVVLAFGLIGVTGMMLTSVRGNTAGSKMTIAASMAQDKMEELRNTPFKRLYKTCLTSDSFCAAVPDAMALDRDAAVLEQANDSGTDGDELIGTGAGDGIWTYKMNLAVGHPDNPFPVGMTLIWGVRRNYPAHNMIWLFSDVIWKNRVDEADRRVHLESIMGSFEK